MSAPELLRTARERASAYARMSAQDTAELVAVFAQVARRQARDALTELTRRARRSSGREKRR